MTLSVIGAGWGRTGTSSLKEALEALGMGRCHHMVEVLRNPRQAELWEQAGNGSADWETIFAGYRTTVDWPSCAFYSDLARYYPDAKVILTTRDPVAWCASAQATIFKAMRRAYDPASPVSRMMTKVIIDPLGGDLDDSDHLIALYNRHNEEVRAAIPAERLLVFDTSEGWEPLCRFLGHPMPTAPFPHLNTTDDFQRMMLARAPAASS